MNNRSHHSPKGNFLVRNHEGNGLPSAWKDRDAEKAVGSGFERNLVRGEPKRPPRAPPNARFRDQCSHNRTERRSAGSIVSR